MLFLLAGVGAGLLYSAQIGLRNSTQLCALWIPAFAPTGRGKLGMTVIKFFAHHSVWSISVQKGMNP